MNKPTTPPIPLHIALKVVSPNHPLMMVRESERSPAPVCVIEESRVAPEFLYARTLYEKGLIIVEKTKCEFFEMPKATVAEGA